MTIRNSVAAALLTALGAGLVLGDDNPFRKKPPFKTAIIEYTMAGSEQGHATLYVEVFKQAKVTEASTSFKGMTSPVEKKAVITTPERIIEVNITEKTALAHGNIKTYMEQEYEKFSAADKAMWRKNSEKMGTALVTGLLDEVPKTESGTYLGKPVDISTVKGVTSQIWKDTGIILKSEGVGMMGMKISDVATSIKVDVPLPAGVFEAPAGIKVVFNEQADKVMRNMAVEMMTHLKDPNFK